MLQRTSSSPDPVRQTIDLPGHGSFSVLHWDGDRAKSLLVFAHATGFNAGTYRELAESLHGAGYLFVAAIAVFVLAAVVVKRLLTRAEARHWSSPGDGDANTREDPED